MNKLKEIPKIGVFKKPTGEENFNLILAINSPQSMM